MCARHRLLVPGLVLIVHLLRTRRRPAVQVARAVERAPAHAVVDARIILLHFLVAVARLEVHGLGRHRARREVVRLDARLEHARVQPLGNDVRRLLDRLRLTARDLVVKARRDVLEDDARHDDEADDDDGQHEHQDLCLDAARPRQPLHIWQMIFCCHKNAPLHPAAFPWHAGMKHDFPK